MLAGDDAVALRCLSGKVFDPVLEGNINSDENKKLPQKYIRTYIQYKNNSF